MMTGTGVGVVPLGRVGRPLGLVGSVGRGVVPVGVVGPLGVPMGRGPGALVIEVGVGVPLWVA